MIEEKGRKDNTTINTRLFFTLAEMKPPRSQGSSWIGWLLIKTE